MKCLCLLGFLLMVSFNSIGQSKDQHAVSEAVEKLRKAMVDGDSLALEAVLSDSLSYGHSSGKVETKAVFVGNLVSGKSDFVTISLSDQTIAVYKDIAIVRHILNAATNDGGKPATVKLHVLLVWKKDKGAWKLLARQAVKLT